MLLDDEKKQRGTRLPVVGDLAVARWKQDRVRLQRGSLRWLLRRSGWSGCRGLVELAGASCLVVAAVDGKCERWVNGGALIGAWVALRMAVVAVVMRAERRSGGCCWRKPMLVQGNSGAASGGHERRRREVRRDER